MKAHIPPRAANVLEALAAEQDAHAKTKAERDYLKRREVDIIEACAPVADGGQYRSDIISAVRRIRKERDALLLVARIVIRIAERGPMTTLVRTDLIDALSDAINKVVT